MKKEMKKEKKLKIQTKQNIRSYNPPELGVAFVGAHLFAHSHHIGMHQLYLWSCWCTHSTSVE
jgi:hypothetical protein